MFMDSISNSYALLICPQRAGTHELCCQRTDPDTIFTVLPAALTLRQEIECCFFLLQLVELKNWYCREFRDPMMVDPPGWFRSFVFCEVAVQFPFFFVAAFAYLKGKVVPCISKAQLFPRGQFSSSTHIWQRFYVG